MASWDIVGRVLGLILQEAYPIIWRKQTKKWTLSLLEGRTDTVSQTHDTNMAPVGVATFPKTALTHTGLGHAIESQPINLSIKLTYISKIIVNTFKNIWDNGR